MGIAGQETKKKSRKPPGFHIVKDLAGGQQFILVVAVRRQEMEGHFERSKLLKMFNLQSLNYIHLLQDLHTQTHTTVLKSWRQKKTWRGLPHLRQADARQLPAQHFGLLQGFLGVLDWYAHHGGFNVGTGNHQDLSQSVRNEHASDERSLEPSFPHTGR